MSHNVIQTKLEGALHRGYFRTIDLFAGCGGMSLGFDRAAFKCISAIELDDNARASHRENFAPLAAPDIYAAHEDITNISPEDAVVHLKTPCDAETEIIDVIIGGPPCQAFSRLGRARLWELSGRKHAHKHDERATMYQYFLEYVARLQPIAFVMENVREMGKFVGRNVAEEIALTAEDLGYNVRYTLLNAVWFDVPQLRERAFIIGIHKDLGVLPRFPYIKCKYNLPVGYSTARAGTGKVEFLEPHDHYVDHLEFSSKTRSAVTVEEAFADLPPIYYHLDGRTGKGVPRCPNIETEYTESENRFTRQMRNWPRFKSDASTFTGHIIRYTPRDYEIFKRMPPGGMYPEAHKTALAIFKERLREKERERKCAIVEGSPDWHAIYKATVPPYPVTKYPNKFRKMWPDHPARTVPAHIGKDSYSHIHFDSEQARCISMREAARLQSFPDAFRLSGSMNAVLRQIGNAVPPLLAFAVASALKRTLISGISTGTIVQKGVGYGNIRT